MKDVYEDFEVRLERFEDRYFVRVKSPVGPAGPVEFAPPKTDDILSFADQLSPSRRLMPVDPQPRPGTPAITAKELGVQLFDALFNGDVLDAWQRSQYVAKERGLGLRLRLRFDGTADLASLPWELMYDSTRRRFPGRLSDHPTVRTIETQDPISPLNVDGALRMLVVISSPRDLAPLDVEAEWSRLHSTLAPLSEPDATGNARLEITRLPVASLDALLTAVTESEFHIFHFIGHGGVDSSGGGLLAFTDDSGRARLEPCSHVADILGNSPIRLAVLNSCEGARATAVDPYASAAITFVEQGIPAVVAMQFEISDLAAQVFSAAFYAAVTARRPIDVATTLGRQAILATSAAEWATPVLYMHADDTKAFIGPAKGGLTPPPNLPPPSTLPTIADTVDLDEALAVVPAPHITAAGAKGDTVTLAWEQPYTPGVTVDAWQVIRNNALRAEVFQPAFVDTPGAVGAYEYSVVASADGQESPRSAVATVRVRGRLYRAYFSGKRPRYWLWILTALTLYSLVNPSAALSVAPPTNLRVTTGTTVTLRWDAAPSGSKVTSWEVRKDAVLVDTTTTPMWRDPVPPAGLGHVYGVRAVTSAGMRSDEVTVRSDPGDETTSPATGAPRVRHESVHPAA